MPALSLPSFRTALARSCIALLALTLLPSVVRAQARPRVERVFVPPQTVWAERGRAAGRAVMARIAARRAVPSEARAALDQLHGDIRGDTMTQVMIPIGFAGGDVVPFDPAVLKNRFYGPGNATEYSLSQFYDEASFGRFTLTGRVAPQIILPRTSKEYVGDITDEGVADSLAAFLQDALTAADTMIDFGPFADPERAADGKHYVSAVIFLTAGPGGNCPGITDRIWPHRFRVDSVLGEPFQTRSVAPNGDPLYVNDYIVVGAEECSPGEMAHIGILAHETGHLLGLPDLYYTDGPNDARGPVGNWDLMATGNYNQPTTPAQFGAWSRTFLGWTRIRQLAEFGGFVSADSLFIALSPVSDAGEVVVIPFKDNPAEFLLIENRLARGSDIALAEEGLLFWYVNTARANVDTIRANRVNLRTKLPGVALIQADNRHDLENGTAIPGEPLGGDSGDPFPGRLNNRWFTALTGPAFTSPVDNRAGGYSIHIVEAPREKGEFATMVVYADPAHTADPPPTEAIVALTIQPDSLPAVVAGEEYMVQLTVADTLDPDETLRWSAPTEQLARLGLTLDALTGVLHGQIVSHDSVDTLDVTVTSEKSNPLKQGTRRYLIRIYQPLSPSVVGQLIAALLDPVEHPLPTTLVTYMDEIGNRNGTYDQGDLVRAVRRGAVPLSPDDRISLANSLTATSSLSVP